MRKLAIPLTGLLNSERRDDWAAGDLFASPGPRQFWGPTTHQQPISVALNSGSDSLMFRIG